MKTLLNFPPPRIPSESIFFSIFEDVVPLVEDHDSCRCRVCAADRRRRLSTSAMPTLEGP